MAKRPQSLEEWLQQDKKRITWLEQQLRDEGIRSLQFANQDPIDRLISDFLQRVPQESKADAIRKLKQNWRVHKCNSKRSTLSASVSKRTHTALKNLATARRKTQKATLEELIQDGFQSESDKKAAIEEAVNQAKLSHFEKHSPLEWPPLSSVFTRETESLRETIAVKDEEIHRLRKELESLNSASIEKDESDIAPGSAPDIDDKAEPEPPKLEPTRNVGEILYNRKKSSS